jgi:hypothetical protein
MQDQNIIPFPTKEEQMPLDPWAENLRRQWVNEQNDEPTDLGE